MFCKKCGKEIRQEAVFCPNCGAPVSRFNLTGKIFCKHCGKEITYSQKSGEQPSEKNEKKRKIGWKRVLIIAGVAVAAAVVCFLTYIPQNQPEEAEVVANSSDMETILDSEEGVDTNVHSPTPELAETVEQYQGTINEAFYLDLDKLIMIELNNGERHYINLDGTCASDTVTLQSQYFSQRSVDNFVNIYDEEISFSSDKSALYSYGGGVTSTPEGDVIWVQTETSDLNGTVNTLTAYDEFQSQIFQIDSNDPIFTEPGHSKDDLKDSIGYNCNGVSYCGGRIFCVADILINIDTGEKFENYGENFSSGYGISIHGIRDVHGNFVIDATTSPAFRRIVNEGSDFTQFQDGLFYVSDLKGFYDINLNCVLNLSQYNITSDSLRFQDNLCAVELKNPDGDALYGLIDKQGNWVFGPSDDTDLPIFYPYDGRISASKVLFGGSITTGKIYDLKDQIFTAIPLYHPYAEDIALLGGYCYYLESGELKCYDIEQEMECEFPSEEKLSERIEEFSDICSATIETGDTTAAASSGISAGSEPAPVIVHPEDSPTEQISVQYGLTAPASDFLFPHSSDQILTQEQLDSMIDPDVEVMRSRSQMAINEILARYGYPFGTSTRTAREAKDHFLGLEWYEQAKSQCSYEDPNALIADMNDVEQTNIDLINEWQIEQNIPPL